MSASALFADICRKEPFRLPAGIHLVALSGQGVYVPGSQAAERADMTLREVLRAHPEGCAK